MRVFLNFDFNVDIKFNMNFVIFVLMSIGIGSTGSTVFPVAGAASGAFLGAAVMALKTSGISEMIPVS